jgi:hypothetical protein
MGPNGIKSHKKVLTKWHPDTARNLYTPVNQIYCRYRNKILWHLPLCSARTFTFVVTLQTAVPQSSVILIFVWIIQHSLIRDQLNCTSAQVEHNSVLRMLKRSYVGHLRFKSRPDNGQVAYKSVLSISASLSLPPSVSFPHSCVATTLEHRASVKWFVSLQFLNPKTVGKTPWTGDQHFARPLPTQNNTNTE